MLNYYPISNKDRLNAVGASAIRELNLDKIHIAVDTRDPYTQHDSPLRKPLLLKESAKRRQQSQLNYMISTLQPDFGSFNISPKPKELESMINFNMVIEYINSNKFEQKLIVLESPAITNQTMKVTEDVLDLMKESKANWITSGTKTMVDTLQPGFGSFNISPKPKELESMINFNMVSKYISNDKFEQELIAVGSPAITNQTMKVTEDVLDLMKEKYPNLDFQVLPDEFGCIYAETCPVDEKGISLTFLENGDIRMFIINSMGTKREVFSSISKFEKSSIFIEFMEEVAS